jgi:hypothetical protein
MNKQKYFGLIAGVVVGMAIGFNCVGGTGVQDGVLSQLPVSLGMIGYAVGALFGTNTATSGDKN